MRTDPLSTLVLPGTRGALAAGTPQSEPADERQVVNHAGGHTFVLDELGQLRRFLVLGTTGGSYYTGEAELTRDNADLVVTLARTRGTEVVAEVLALGNGRAPKQNPSLFALAAVAGLGDDEARKLALSVLPQVARTGTHLFIFTRYVEMFRGWGRGLRRAVSAWYLDRSPSSAAHQVAKYRQREGWSHRDLLRLAHPAATDPAQRAVLRFAAGHAPEDGQPLPDLLEGYVRAQSAATVADTVRLVLEYGLSWEMVRGEHIAEPRVWSALLTNGMPQTALIRNLPRLTRYGLLDGRSQHTRQVAEQLVDPVRLREARVHPLNLLIALRTYARGTSTRGDSAWTPVRSITDALDAAFYASFGTVEPTGKRIELDIDISGSMGMQYVMDSPVSAREASAALALATIASEPADVGVYGFTAEHQRRSGYGWGYNVGFDPSKTALTPLDLSPRRRLDDNVKAIAGLPMGATDCALPMVRALAEGREVDTFVIYTDNETWAGSIHPHQALARYRKETGIPARLVVAGLTATRLTIADPTDAGMLDVVGLDAAVPSLISDFARGVI